MADDDRVRRVRFRRASLRINDKGDIADRVVRQFTTSESQTDIDRGLRIQREAKLRLWSEGESDWPWPGASDVALPLMLEKSLRTQDTLHNAVMTSRPVIRAKALNKHDKGKEDAINALIDYQVFVEQKGEDAIGDLAQAFTDDGVAVAYIPWVTEKREVSHTQIYDPLPDGADPVEFHRNILLDVFPDIPPDNMTMIKQKDGWDWRVAFPESDEKAEESTEVAFYTRSSDRSTEVVFRSDVVVYDGPTIIVKDYDEVYTPPRTANLQPPSPSNPRGSSYVILVDRPTVDEVLGLIREGFYDLASDEDKKSIMAASSTGGADQATERARDDFGGTSATDIPPKDRFHRRLTRLMCFDRFDMDGDGQAEDIVWWVIKETKTLLKARRLTEVFPSNPPMRPLAEASFIPVRGRRQGVSLSELTEGLQDAMKVIIDQTLNAGDIQNTPFGFYRPQGAMQPETIRMMPGEMYPVGDPQRDVSIPTLTNNAVGFGINMFTLMQQLADRLTMISEVELGRVPAGKSAALRTASGIAQLTAKGEARPQRIMRRFFGLLTQIWQIIHQHNQRRLPKKKQVLINGLKNPHENPYLTIESRTEITGPMSFDFKATVMNTAADQLQQGLDQILGLAISPLMLQLGLVDQDTIFRTVRDWAKARGLDPDDYFNAPLPTSILPKISAEEAITALAALQEPFGIPSEAGGWVEHLEKLFQFTQTEQFGILEEEGVELFTRYFQTVQGNAEAQAAQQQAIEQAASGSQQNQNQGGRPPGGAGAGNQDNPQISGGNELLDETLPGAGGGGNQ